MDLLCRETVTINDCDHLIGNYGNKLCNKSKNVMTGTLAPSSGVTTAVTIGLTQTTTTTYNHYLSSNNNNNHHQQNHNRYITKTTVSALQHQMETRVNTALKDPTFLAQRCLENLLKLEENCTNVCTYFNTVQKDNITPEMRKLVAQWMMEVCEEQRCQEEVFILALIYLDRFLATGVVHKTHLQILGAACLLLASKLREPSCRGLLADTLVFYTDHSIKKVDLIQWELVVLSRLKWDISLVTPLDFLELLLIRLPIDDDKCPDLNSDKIRKHAQTFISLAAKEHSFSIYSASTIAASSIAASLSGLNWHLRTGIKMNSVLALLNNLTGVEQEDVKKCMIEMEYLLDQQKRILTPFSLCGQINDEAIPVATAVQSTPINTNNNNNNNSNNNNINNNNDTPNNNNTNNNNSNGGSNCSNGGSPNGGTTPTQSATTNIATSPTIGAAAATTNTLAAAQQTTNNVSSGTTTPPPSTTTGGSIKNDCTSDKSKLHTAGTPTDVQDVQF